MNLFTLEGSRHFYFPCSALENIYPQSLLIKLFIKDIRPSGFLIHGRNKHNPEISMIKEISTYSDRIILVRVSVLSSSIFLDDIFNPWGTNYGHCRRKLHHPIFVAI